MRNPTRRNRNIGTANQGYGKSNEMTIANERGEHSFYERLTNYTKIKKVINGHEFEFVVEETRNNCVHACSIEDVATIIGFIPVKDYGALKTIVFRQPKRKEELLNPVWGRLIYSYNFENDYYPAIIIDAVDLTKKLKWSVKLDPEDTLELVRLKADGHVFVTDKRWHIAELQIEPVRNTQLYRTLLHEFGHYVHYLQEVECCGEENEDYEIRDARWDIYKKISKQDKERFAHSYADGLTQKLRVSGQIPFSKLV